MTEVPVRVLVEFKRSLDGIKPVTYYPGDDVYTLPHRVATYMARLGKVEILEVAKEKPKKKKSKAKTKKEPDNG